MALTLKQENFAREYIKTGNATESYRQAYDAENMSQHAQEEEAYRLMQNPEVALMVDKLKSNLAKKYEVTMDSITSAMRVCESLAREHKQINAAVNANVHIAKMHGVYVEKTKQEVDITPQTRIIIEVEKK